MEIDLELPSNENEKLNVGVNRNAEPEDCTDGMHHEQDNRNSPVNERVRPFGGSNLTENILDCGSQADANIHVGETIDKGAICEPQNGLEFDSKEAAYYFYREYARSVGFGITIKSSRRSKKSGNFIDVKIACSRFGSKRDSSTNVNPRSCPKTDCKAVLHLKRRQDGKWVIYSFVKEHNHEICVDDFYNTIRGRGKQSAVASKKKGLQMALDEGDVQEMLEYFMLMQAKNPNFFYAIDLDPEKCLRSVFWVDSKGRHDYNYFCDAVFFDTYYIESKYKIPFSPVIGVNHHFQFTLLGCALIGEETESAFIWSMHTWLKAMGGKAPRVVLTGQNKFIKEAVADVFPDARHCFCLWHVLRNLTEYFGDSISQNEEFLSNFNGCIYQSWTEDQFETQWWKMIDRFEQRENEQVQLLYEDRRKWIPTYMRDVFFAGMSTTDRSGSITSYFDKYLQRETTFKKFIQQYNAYLQDRCEMEAKADFETLQRKRALKSPLPFEKQMSSLYTEAVFKQFQAEVMGVDFCTLQKEREDYGNILYQVDDFEHSQKFIVAWNEAELDLRCLCHLFEYRGFLCRHAMLVLRMSGISNIPSHYILRRWTGEAKVRLSVGAISDSKCRVHRFNDLCKRAIKLGEKGSLSQEAYSVAIQALEEVLKHCASTNKSAKSTSDPSVLPNRGLLNGKEQNHTSKRKKTYKKRKALTEENRSSTVMDGSFQNTEDMNMRAVNQDNCYVPQQRVQEMEPNSRVPTLDGYYGSQQNMQDEGHMNSISSIHDGYYSSQQGMQGLGQLHPITTRIGPYGAQPSLQGLMQGPLSFRAPTMHGCFDIQDDLQDIEQSMSSRQFQNTATKRMHD